ncbi:MAG: GNAT family N-acetyltransferase [Nitriliruptorales bacterium]|nr:GNAT family N-acetyltransferase [Nitriliruptorales bacterium]
MDEQTHPDLAHDAAKAAAEAADRADVEIRDVHELDELERMSSLFDEVWGRDDSAATIMAPELLRAMSHAGNQVSGAFRDGEMVAATAALLGLHDDQVHLHSHVTGVVADAQGVGIGWAMKQHQRAWCLERGITTVRWTFDPLIRRNAVFNLTKLGARIVDFVHDLYGRMPDARNVGLPTDRAVASWELTERRVQLASSGRFAEPRLDALKSSGAEPVLEAGPDGEPQLQPVDDAARLVLAQVPDDIESLRAQDQALGERWAQAFREEVGERIRSDYRVTGITRDGWYVLGRDETVAELSS